ncbi:MAG: hypothetical protein HKP56_06530 [Anderseniella sp.]|nr:hypothetical protein [Anderseniella sp.]
MGEYRFGVLSILVGALYCMVAVGSVVQSAETRQQIIQRVNSTTVTIVTGGLDSTSARLVEDLGTALNDGETQRILPLLGFGSAQNISDILYLKGVDAGIVHADVLDAVLKDSFIPDINLTLQYIAELGTENIFIVAGKDIGDISDLAGKTVNFGAGAGDGYTPSALLFKSLGIDVKHTNHPDTVALEKMTTGEISATVVLGNNLKKIAADLGSQDNLRLLPIPQAGLSENYVSSTVTAGDFPNITPANSSIDTVAVRLVLVVNNWPVDHPRHKKVVRFVETFFSGFKNLQQSPYDPRWKNVNLAAVLPGWTRFPRAKDWLAEHEGEQTVAVLKEKFETFLLTINGSTASVTAEQKAKMFNDFLAWTNNGSEAKIPVRLTSARGLGKKLGTLTIKNTEIVVGDRTETALLVEPNIKGLKSGKYAFHIHQKPDCGPAQKDGTMVPGLGAGGHLWLTYEGQTLGSHLGDLPDFTVDEDGTATKPIVAARLSLADVVNRAIMIHASSEDTSGRLACGVIK